MVSVFSSSVNELPWLIRADFTDQVGWEEVARAVRATDRQPDDSQVDFDVIDDAEYAGLTPARLLQLEPCRSGTFFLVDHVTLTHPEHPLLAVDVSTEPGKSFRLIPSEVQEFAVNMLIANMDFADFGDNVDQDGIFRGFTTGPSLPDLSVHSGGSEAVAGNAVGTIDDLRNEADADDANSFIGQLIREGFWNPASWQRLEGGMREACRRYEHSADIPRDLAAAFHSVMVRTPNVVAQPGMVPMDPGALEIRLERIRVLSSWFFRGWTLERPEGPIPGDHDPNASHG